jgi:radical SAM protein with 4Fe4S-binding SPASM domain
LNVIGGAVDPAIPEDRGANDRTSVSAADIRAEEIQDFVLWEKLRAGKAALSFDLEITARCNNDCRHCYINLPAGDREAESRELTRSESLEIARQAMELGAMWCLVSGGEPLLREDFGDIYLGLKRMGMLVSVFTNATLMSEEHAELFRAFPPRDIEVTVYGVTEETYERVSGRRGSFAAFKRGFDLLLQSGVKVRLKAMAMRSNMSELPAIREFCERHTKDFFRYDSMLHGRFDADPGRNAMIRAERLTPEEIVRLEREDAKKFGALQRHFHEFLSPEFAHSGCDHLFHCGAGLGNFSVGYDGTFRLCSSLWAPETTFDLRRGTLREAWEIVVPRVRGMRSRSQEFLATCRKCPLINLCLWCPAHAYLESGRMDVHVPYFCAVAHARAEAISGESEGG